MLNHSKHRFASGVFSLILFLSGVITPIAISVTHAGAAPAWASTVVTGTIDVSSVSSTGTKVSKVQCFSATSCIGVGQYLDQSYNSQPFVTVFNGTSWVSTVLPLPSARGGGLRDLSCVSSSFCVAGGYYSTLAGQTRALVEVYNGTSWTAVDALSSSSSVTYSEILSLSCVSSSFCVATGPLYDGNSKAYVAVYNGSTWAKQDIANNLSPMNISQGFSVSCASTTFCVETGYFYNSLNQNMAYISMFNGSSWATQQIQVGLQGSVTNVSCVSSTFCVAAGYTGTYPYQAFTAKYTGQGSTWTSTNIAQFSGVTTSYVNTLNCSSTTLCITGGWTSVSGVPNAYASVFNGTTWVDSQLTGSLRVGNASDAVTSASCISDSFCVAVGYYSSDVNYHTQGFASIYNGSTWTSSQVGGDLSVSTNYFAMGSGPGLYSVSCATSSFCAASGQIANSSNKFQGYVSVYSSPGSAVTYANGGGAGTLPTQTALASAATFTVAANTLTKSGYNFAGWSDGANTYQPGSTYTMGSSPVTLTAVWVTPPIVYSKPTAPSNVTASMNNGTATVSFTPGTSGNLPTYNQIDMLINGQSVGNVCNVTGATSCPISNLGSDAAFSFTVTAVNSKGSATSSVSNVVSYAPPTTVTPTTTTTTTTMPPAKQTITCVKGATSKKVTAVSPVCPAGYRKK